MPQLIAVAAIYLAEYGYIAWYVAATVVVATTVYGSAEARRKQRAATNQARAAYNASLQDRSVTVMRADPPWRTVYGQAVTGGEIVAILTSDKTGTRLDGSSYTKADALKHLVVAICAHECQAIGEIYIDGVAIGALDANGYVTGGEFQQTAPATRELSIAAGGTSTQAFAVTVHNAWDETLSTYPDGGPEGGNPGVLVAASYTLTVGNTVITNTGANPMRISFDVPVVTSTVRVQKHLGSATQTADAMLLAALPAEWTSADRLQGITYAVVTLDLENQRFQGGPPNITFAITGKKLYDPRNGLTAWSANPALCIRDFLTGEHGLNCVAADVDDAACIVAANACDVVVNFTTGASTTSGATYTCNGVFTSDQGREAMLQDLAECMAGTVTYGAQWLIQAGVWTAPVMALTDDDLHGQIEISQGGAGMAETFNTVRGQYVPANGSVPADFDPYANAAFVAADGRSLFEDVALPFTNDKARARNLARIFVERNRDGLIVRYPAKLRAWPLQIGDRVSVTSAEYGFSVKYFRVTDWQFGLTSPVMLTLQEDAAAIYDQADAATSDPAANSGLPNPWVVAAPSSVTVSSGTSVAGLSDGGLGTRVRVAWAAITDPYMADGAGFVLVRWRRQLYDAVNMWQTLAPVPASELYTFITGAQDGNAITVEVRFRNGLGAVSAAAYVTHTVVDNSVPARTDQISIDAATEVASSTAAAPTVTGTYNASYGAQIGILQEVSWYNDTGETIYVEATIDNGGIKTAGSGGAYLYNYGGTSAFVAGGTNNGDLLNSTQQVTTVFGRRTTVRGFTVANGATAYAQALGVTTPTAGSPVTLTGSDVTVRLAMVKR